MQVILVNLNNCLVSLNSTWLAQIAPSPPTKKDALHPVVTLTASMDY